MRGNAPNASDPVTRSIGSLPAVPLVKAYADDGGAGFFGEVDDWLQAATGFGVVMRVFRQGDCRDNWVENGKHDAALHIFHGLGEHGHIGRGVEWTLAADVLMRADNLDALQIRTHSGKARDYRIGDAVFGGPNQDVSQRRAGFVRPMHSGRYRGGVT